MWDDSPVPWWSQLRRRRRDDPGVWSLLERALGEHPATSGRLTGLRPLRPARPSFSAWLTGTCHPDDTDVLVKVNAGQLLPQLVATPSHWAQRLAVARGFAGYLKTVDPATEVPPAGVFPARRHRPAPYLWSEEEVCCLLREVGTLRPRLRASTHQALFGLLAATGMPPSATICAPGRAGRCSS